MWIESRKPNISRDKVNELTLYTLIHNSLESVIFELNQYMNGWISYFRLAKNKSTCRDFDSWIRRRLRCYRLRQRKRAWSIITYLVNLGVSMQNAAKLGMSGKGWWRMSLNPIINMAMPIQWFKEMGLVSLEDKITKFNSLTKTAVCDNARTVV